MMAKLRALLLVHVRLLVIKLVAKKENLMVMLLGNMMDKLMVVKLMVASKAVMIVYKLERSNM